MTPRRTGVPPRAYALLALGSLCYLSLMFVWFSLPAFLAPIIDELGLSSTQAGLLTGAVPLTYVPLSLLTGLAIDRIGARRGMGAGLVLFSLAQIGRGFADGFLPMLALTVAIGVGATTVTFGLPKLASELFPSELLGSASSAYLLGSYAGSAAAFGLGRRFFGPALGGWRAVFVASGVAVAGFSVVWFAASRLYERRQSAAVGADPATADGGDEPTFSVQSLRRDLTTVVTSRGMVLLVVVGTMYLFIAHGLQGWLTVLLEVRGVPAGLAATVTSLLIVAQAVGAVTIPPASDALGRRRPMVILCGALAAAGTFGLLVADGVAAAVLVVGAVGTGIGGLSPLLRAIPAEMEAIGPRLTATAVGLIFAVGEIGGFLGPFLVGALRDAVGAFAPGVALLGAGGLVIVAAGFAMSDPDADAA